MEQSEDVLNKKISEGKLLEVVYWDGVMLFLNACIGEKWREVMSTEDWEMHFPTPLIKEADFIARYVEEAKITPHAEALAYHFEKLKDACLGNTYRDLSIAVTELGLVGYHGAHVMAAREVAKSKVEQSKKLLRKRLTPIETRRRALLDIWLSGKYSSRDRCADEEWEGLNFPSFRAARESLNGSPDPTKKQ